MFLEKPFEKHLHEGVPLAGKPPALSREDAIMDLAELEFELAISGVVLRVWKRVLGSREGVVKPGADFAREQKGSGHADGADRIQLVRIEQYPGLCRSGRLVAAEAVAADAMQDIRLPLLSQRKSRHNRSRQFRPLLGMAYRTGAVILVAAADVMQESGRSENIHVGPLDLPDMLAEAQDPQCMVPCMTGPRSAKMILCNPSDMRQQMFARAGGPLRSD